MAIGPRRPQGKVTGSLTLLVFASVGLTSVLPGCVHPDDVKLRVIIDAPNGGPGRPIENLRVYAGGSKSWWPTVAPGDSVSVLLRPEGGPPQVTMSYQFSGRTLWWNGPEIAKGVGYAISIHIGTTGAVTEKHCTLPCSWP